MSFVALLFLCGCAEKGKKRTVIGVMPKLVGIDFFNAVEKGAKEAGKEVDVTLVYDGPVVNDVTKQASIVETWIARGFDAICIAPNDPDAIAPVLQKAGRQGIKIVSFDADANPKARDYFVNQATYESVARALVDTMVKGIGPKGRFIIITGALTAVNQNIWMEHMEKYRAANYPQMLNLSDIPKVSEEDQSLATQVTIDVLKSYPDLDGIYALTSVALPGAAEALKKKNAEDRIYLTGLSTPNAMRDYVKKGIVKEFVLWSPVDLGYLAVHTAKCLIDGTITEDTPSFEAGRLGEIQIGGNEVLLGDPLIFNADNIDNYDF